MKLKNLKQNFKRKKQTKKSKKNSETKNVFKDKVLKII